MTNKELYHFGIKGQKWGRRRWQYEDGRFNREGKIRYFGYPKERVVSVKNDLVKNNNHFKLSDKQKKYIKIGASVAAIGLATYGLYKINKLPKETETLGISKARELLNDSISSISMPNRIEPVKEIKDLVAKSNPTHSQKNCKSISVNNCLRMLGYDTKDIPDAVFGNDKVYNAFGLSEGKQIRRMQGGIFKNSSDAVEAIKRNIIRVSRNDAGDSFGTLSFSWNERAGSGGHIINWKKVGENINLFDGQWDEIEIGSNVEFLLKRGLDFNKEVTIANMTSPNINWDLMSEFVKKS